MMVSKSQVYRVLQAYLEKTRPMPGMESEGTGKPVASRADRVDLSAEARKMQRFAEALTRTPDIRMERVQELKAMIESGGYRVSSEDIAEKIVNRAIVDEMV
jgi:negative regulator of flagellin synthesis FlgM